MIYANTMSATGGPIELSLDFGYQLPPNGDTTWAIRIVVAWEHARLIHDLLGESIERYAREVGDIRDLTAATKAQLGAGNADKEGKP
jgi:hypothetical protein